MSEGTLRPYEPTLRERSTKSVANFLRDKMGMDNYRSYELARDIFGDSSADSFLGSLGAATFSPAEAIYGGQEGARQYKRADDLLGKGIGAATVGLSALEAFPATALMAKGIKRMFPKSGAAEEAVDVGRRKVSKGIAALPIAATGIAKVISDLPTGAATATKAAVKSIPEVTGSSFLDKLPFIQKQLKSVYYLRKDSPQGDLQAIYHLDDMKTELEELAGIPRFPGPSAKNKEELLDKPLDDFYSRVAADKKELIDEVAREGFATDSIQSPITFELIEDFMDMNPGMTLREAIKKVDDEIKVVLKSKNIDSLSDVDLEPGYLTDTAMQMELGANRPVYMGAGSGTPDPTKSFRDDDDFVKVLDTIQKDGLSPSAIRQKFRAEVSEQQGAN